MIKTRLTSNYLKQALALPLFFFLLLTGCKDTESTPTPPTNLVLSVLKQNLSASGEITETPVSSTIYVWKADNKDFDVNASGTDIYIGYAYEKNSKSYINAQQGGIGLTLSEELAPGRYFVYVLLPKTNKTGSQAYSYTYLNIAEGQTLTTKKVFSHNVGTKAYEEWSKNQ